MSLKVVHGIDIFPYLNFAANQIAKVGNTEFESLLIFYNYYKSTINLE